MKKLIFINTNRGTSTEIIKTAVKMGYEVNLLTDKNIDLADVSVYKTELTYQKIINTINNNKLNNDLGGIFSFADGYVYLAAKVADYFKVSFLNTPSAKIMEDKLLIRNKFKEDDFNINFSKNYSDKFTIAKKANSCASKDVFLVNRSLGSNYFYEEFIKGEQYLMEVLIKDYKPIFICKIKQNIVKTAYNTFIVDSYTVDKLDLFTANELKMLSAVIKKLQIKTQHIHIEYKIRDGEVKLIEINPRISGFGMDDLLNHICGENYLEIMLNCYLNEKFDRPKIIRDGYLKMLYSNQRMEIKDINYDFEKLKKDNICKVKIFSKKGETIYKIKHMGDRFGYVLKSDFKDKKIIGLNVQLKKPNSSGNLSYFFLLIFTLFTINKR